MSNARHLVLRSWSGTAGVSIVVLYLLVAAAGPLADSVDPLRQDLDTALAPPGRSGHILGTDELGRDVLSRIVHGSRVSLAIGAGAVTTSTVLGTAVGLASGYYGGPLDSLCMRAVDVLLSLPRILIAVTIAAMYGIGFWMLLVAIAFPGIPVFARLARASTFSVSRIDYVAAAKAAGVPELRILRRHILPNIVAPVIVQATFDLAAAILTAGGLSFLGLGIQPPAPEWGSMLAQAKQYMRLAPHLIAFPGLALAVLILGINLLGDALRQAYDPVLRGRN